MPTVSIVIPLYNTGRDLERCLASVLDQTHRALEAIVVDDASTDDSLDVAREWAARDQRVRVVVHERNQGLHLARKSGVAAAQGDYLLFLDSDDELCDATVLERLVAQMEQDPVDVLRFGLEAVPIEGTPADAARQLSAWSSVAMGRLDGREAVRLAFAASENNVLPWHVTHRLFAADLAARAFDLMTGERLERAEDAYEYLVIASLAISERDACDIVGYRYYLGGGVMNSRPLEADAFLAQCASLRACYAAALDYAASSGDALMLSCATDFKRKLLETAGTMWHDRVAAQDKPATALALADLLGVDETCAELFRLVRDRAYEFVATGSPVPTDDELFLLLGMANLVHGMAHEDGPEHERAEALRTTALGHVGELLVPRSELEAERSRSALLEEQLSAMAGSVSFSIGRAVTAPLRMVRSIVLGGKRTQ